MLKKYYLFFISCILFTDLGYANDTAGTTSAGGITFTKSPEISMEQEELQIGPDKVTVKYHFKNNTAQNVVRNVYFPLPAYQYKGANTTWDEEVNPQIKKSNWVPFINFSVKVNGVNQPFSTIIRAVLNGQDITSHLNRAQLPLNPGIVNGDYPMMDVDMTELAKIQQKAKRLGFYDDKLKARWQKQVMYCWKQNFPAHSTIVIEHQYRPAAGIFFSAPIAGQTTATRISEDLTAMKRIFKINPEKLEHLLAFKQWLENRIEQTIKILTQNPRAENVYAYFWNVDYILTTGANWSGPIRQFKLRIDYPADGAVMYNPFYGKQPKTIKTQPGTIEIQIQNFKPAQDLRIIFGLATFPKQE